MTGFRDIDARLALADIVAEVMGDRDAGEANVSLLRQYVGILRAQVATLRDEMTAAQEAIAALRVTVANHETRIRALGG